MMGTFKKLCLRSQRFRKNEEGAATIEFVILFPMFMTVFLAAYEASFTMLQSVFLERAADISVRQLRLGNPDVDSAEKLGDYVCNELAIVPDCDETIQVALQSVDTSTWSPRPTDIPCRERDEPIDPLTQPTFDTGESNELMFVRFCVKVRPFFGDATALSLGQIRPAGTDYNIFATTAFVNEPR